MWFVIGDQHRPCIEANTVNRVFQDFPVHILLASPVDERKSKMIPNVKIRWKAQDSYKQNKNENAWLAAWYYNLDQIAKQSFYI